uniref:Uncharacterized protein n=1 Tax=Oryza nivara TaxID=4536 RepID=A0A0E0GEI3_ORYNI
MPPPWLGEARGRITGPVGGAGLERHRHRRPDGSAKGAGGGGLSSSLPVGTIALPGAPPLLCGEFLGGSSSAGEAQAVEAMTPSTGFPFGKNWRGGWRVVEQRGPGPALRGGGSMKSADGGASVRCGGCYMGDGGILDVMTTLVASFSEPHLCGVAIGLAAFGHA